MSYSTYTTILPLVPMLPQSTSAAGFDNCITLIGKHVTRADGLIDAYAAKQYTLPFSTVPPLIRSISEDISIYYTYRSYFIQDNSNMVAYFEELKNDALENLEKIGSGEILLANTSGSLLSTTTILVDGARSSYSTFFDIDEPTSWKFDNDLKDAVSDERD